MDPQQSVIEKPKSEYSPRAVYQNKPKPIYSTKDLTVRAAKIKGIVPGIMGDDLEFAVLHFEGFSENSLATITVDAKWFSKNKPQEGDIWVSNNGNSFTLPEPLFDMLFDRVKVI